jgi:hypothetical protein
MKLGLFAPTSLLALVALALPPSPAAAAAANDALALVPVDAVAVGVIQLADLRANPLSSRLFSDLDRSTVDGDAARFLEETKLNPKEDVDRVVVAGFPKTSGTGGTGLVMFEGRFEPERIAAALVLRGAKRQATPDGDYFLLPEKEGNGDRGEPGAVAVPTKNLLIAGPEAAIRKALAARKAGGTGFTSGSGLGKQTDRIGKGAAVWAIVDSAHLPEKASKKAPSDAAAGLMASMQAVTLLVFQATPKGDGMTFSATGFSPVAETRDNLEDALRGILAIWRLASQEKSPEIVPVLRTFKVEKGREGVTVSGTLPAAVLKAMAEKKKARTDQK